MTWISGEDHPVLQIEIDAAEVEYQDSRQAAIVEVNDGGPDDEDGVFVRVQSWSPSSEHPFIDSLVGRRVRVTIEVMP